MKCLPWLVFLHLYKQCEIFLCLLFLQSRLWPKVSLFCNDVSYVLSFQRTVQAELVQFRWLCRCSQELEIQARVHGLSFNGAGISSGLGASPALLQQQQHHHHHHHQTLPNGQSLEAPSGHHLLGLGAAAIAQPLPTAFLSPPSSDTPAGVTISSPLDLGSLSFAELEETSASALYPDVGLGDILMDEGCALSPEAAGGELLFSPLSPGASKSSSRRSSLEMDEDLWCAPDRSTRARTDRMSACGPSLNVRWVCR